MRMYPAIDLKDGECVRLYKGDYDKKTVYSTDAVATALTWQRSGADFLHVVDLDVIFPVAQGVSQGCIGDGSHDGIRVRILMTGYINRIHESSPLI